MLAENGEVDLAYNMITRPDFPSYGNWVKRGSTTLRESFLPTDDDVDSLNHHFWGDVSAWFYTYLAGMRINPTGKDITNVDIKPLFPEKLDSVNAYHNLPDGKISVTWERETEGIALKIDTSEKLHGKIALPCGYVFADGTAEKDLKSGNYKIIKLK